MTRVAATMLDAVAMPRPRDANRHVSQRLRELRIERGLSQRGVAELLTRVSGSKWAFQAVSRAELCQGTYIRRWSVDDLYMLSAAFGVPASYFLPEEFTVRAGCTGRD